MNMHTTQKSERDKMTKRCSVDVKSPWFFIEDQIPNKDGTAFIVWDEFLDHEIKPIRWSDKIRDYASGEVEWSGSFLFWRYEDGTPAESPRSYQQS